MPFLLLTMLRYSHVSIYIYILCTAYAWVKCEKEENMSCYEVMRSANITGREGSIFRAENRYVRLSLIRSEDDFDILIHHLHKLFTKEDKVASY